MTRAGRAPWLVAAALLAGGCSEEEQKAPPIEVKTVRAVQQDVPIVREWVGQTYGAVDIELRARVDGWLQGIHFREGSIVEQGALLYTIDQSELRQELAAADGRLAEAKTLTARAKSDVDRYQPLAAAGAVSQRDLEIALAEYEARKSEVDAAQAAVDLARIELGYATVRAPITGLIGISTARGRSAGTAGAPSARLTPRLVLTALLLGAVGYATQASLYFAALERVDAALVALVLYTYPVLVTVASVVLGRDQLTPGRTAALVAASAGTVLVVMGTQGVGFDVLGVLLALGAALTYTVYILVGDSTVRQVPPLTLTTLVMTGAAVALTARALVTGGVDMALGPAGWFWVACIAVVSTVVASTAFFAGLRRTGPSSASILSTFEPVATAGLAALVLGELLSPVQLVGGALVLSSVLLVKAPRRTPVAPAPEPVPVRAAQGALPQA